MIKRGLVLFLVSLPLTVILCGAFLYLREGWAGIHVFSVVVQEGAERGWNRDSLKTFCYHIFLQTTFNFPPTKLAPPNQGVVFKEGTLFSLLKEKQA